ncbi:MAG TPA: cytochrome ubiquinol oxidase subunit I [Geminicoccaceae bacterium]|nr:cytochrome ubiquinol oxidase subunit I [Geminicoccus sp.]HMU49230.1 cytochrome ubiquinol oxidase subunit I [Geminicoccaceae bacterium]
MSELDALTLARLQFAFTVSFHIIFPAFTIGLASYLAVLEGLWLLRGDETYRRLFRFWVRIFAVSFGMGVVSGVVLSYQFGTNWSRFSDAVGPTLGPLLAYEVLTAFFLEAGFLGIMLFGWEKVGNALHFTATCLVAVGTLISAFWILAANSWMHTPAGFELVDGRFMPLSWWEVIFNPSFPYRFVHMVLAAYLTTAFAVGAVGAWHLLRDASGAEARRMFSMAMWMAAIVAPIQLLVGDQHGLNTLEHQPAKIAAMEGHFETRRGAPLYLFGIPNMEKAETEYAVGIPKLGSLILAHDPDAELKGLDAFPRDEWPNATVLFWTFRLMVGLGLLMIAVGAVSLVLRARDSLYEHRWFHRLCVAMGPSGFVALLAGWITTEMGRQPWIVQGLMRTADAASPVPAGSLLTSLLLFVATYSFVFGLGMYYLLRLMRQPPDLGPQLAADDTVGSHRPLGAPKLAVDEGA